jgi:hypothetical protein
VSDVAGGAGVLGCGTVYDYGGNDRFMGKNVCFGAGLAGSGVLMKDGGLDEYRGKGLTQGAAMFGVGLCIDTRGNDRYDSGAYAQGFGGTKGFGWLVEQAGNDVYTIGGLHSGAPLDPKSWECMGQGTGSGYREETGGESGGIGLLLDLKGDDLYKGGLYCQGSSYWFALGALIDMDGNDTYIADYYSQSAAMHDTAAYLIDYKGDDIHTVRTGAMHCIGHDNGIAVMLDREGDDIYSGKDSQPSKAIANGVSIFIDSAGNDRYDGPVCVASPSRGTGSLALFVDLGGKDRYAAGIKDGEVSLSSMWAIAMDVADPATSTAAAPTARVWPKLGSAAMPTPAEIEVIFAKAIQWGVGDKQKEVEQNVDKLVAIGVPALDWMLKNFPDHAQPRRRRRQGSGSALHSKQRRQHCANGFITRRNL